MKDTDKVIDIYRKLKKELLEHTGLEINNPSVSNLIILAISEAFEEGVEKGKIKGMVNAIDSLQEVYEKLNNE